MKHNSTCSIRAERRKKILRKRYGRNVLQFNQLGDLLNKFDSINEATEKTKLDNISSVCTENNTKHTAGGYIFMYEDSYSDYELQRRIQNVVRKNIIKIDKKTNKPIAVYKDLATASKIHNIPLPNICQCCNNSGRKSAGGFKWMYIQNVNNDIFEEVRLLMRNVINMESGENY